MNQTALDWAATFTHPRVNDVAREVLQAIARLIPEGETTTPVIGMGMIAQSAHVDRRTVWTWLPVLVEIGAVRVVDGGQGRPARYTLVHVAGASPPIAAALPLRADLQAVRPRPLAATPLFDDPPIVRSESEDLAIPRTTSGPARTITRITSYLFRRITRITSWPFVRSNSEELVIRTCDPCDPDRSEGEELVIGTCDPTLPLEVPITDGLLLSTKKEEVEPSSSGPYVVPAKNVREFVDWWQKTFPTLRGGAQYTLKSWDHGKAAQLLRGRSLERVQAMCTLAMTMTPGGRDDWLATCPDFGISAVLHKATFLDEEVGRREREATVDDDVWQRILARIETRVNRHTFHTWFRPLVRVTDTGTVIEVTKPGLDGQLFVDWVTKHYADVVQAAVDEVRPGSRVVLIDAWAMESAADDRAREGTA